MVVGRRRDLSFLFFFFLTPHPLFTSIKIRFRPKKEIRKNLFFLLFFGAVVVAAGQVYLVFVVFFFTRDALDSDFGQQGSAILNLV